MKRRQTLQYLVTLPTALAGTEAFAGNSLINGRRTRLALRKIIRGEPKNSNTAPAGSYARADSDGLLFLTNGFGFYQIPDDSYIEWHLQQTETQMRFKCLNTDQYRVKAFPCAVLGTMGGRYETLGNPGSVKGLENEFRMKGEGLQSPIFDLEPTQELSGYPCFLSDLPQTDMTISTRYSGNPTVNTFLDMYLHDVDTPETVSHPSLLGTTNGINSNRTKAYNINVWFKKPLQSNGGSTRPDRGWAGGKVVGQANISGHAFNVILKIETGGGNYFRYIALVPEADSINTLNINQVMQWAQTDMRPILDASIEAKQMMAKPDPRGFAPPRWPDEKMVLAGLHIGNEIWWSDPSGQEGVVHWDTLRIDVEGHGTFGWGEKKSAALNGLNDRTNAVQPSANNQSQQASVTATSDWSDEPVDVEADIPQKRGLLQRLLGID